MKRITIISTIVVVLLLTAFVFVRADTRRRQGWCGHGWHHPGPMSFLQHELKLTDGQQAQVQTLWREEQPALSAHVHKLLEENKEMDAIAAQVNPDPSAVQKVADRQAQTIASLLVEKEQLQSKIYTTVLNPGQRVKAEALQKRWESRLDHAAEHFQKESTEK